MHFIWTCEFFIICLLQLNWLLQETIIYDTENNFATYLYCAQQNFLRRKTPEASECKPL